jgi:aminoglycoside 3-N-acetyltransferase
MSRINLLRKRRETIGRESIEEGLLNLGLKKGDAVGVHGSLSSFGYIDRGAEALIDALQEVVGKDGTVIMPTYSTNGIPIRRTQEEIAMGMTWKFKILPYHPDKTSCWTGRIPNTFWKRKGSLRSSDPIYSLAASGRDAKDFCKGWNRLLEADGYILLFHVGLESCSALHLAEEHVQLPEPILKKIRPPLSLLKKYPEPEWSIGFGPYPNFTRLETIGVEYGLVKTTPIGKSSAKLLRLRKLIERYIEVLRMVPETFYGGLDRDL